MFVRSKNRPGFVEKASSSSLRLLRAPVAASRLVRMKREKGTLVPETMGLACRLQIAARVHAFVSPRGTRPDDSGVKETVARRPKKGNSDGTSEEREESGMGRSAWLFFESLFVEIRRGDCRTTRKRILRSSTLPLPA